MLNEGMNFGSNGPPGKTIAITPMEEPVLNMLLIAVFVWSPMNEPTFDEPESIGVPSKGTFTFE